MKITASKLVSLLTSVIPAVTGIVTLLLIYSQLEQMNKLKQFENYVHFNSAYDAWYSAMPERIKTENTTERASWDDLTNDERSWVRRYFDLFAQEYFFYQKEMIPKELWEEHIHGRMDRPGAAFINLKEYPILVEGYHEWKSLGAFDHPPGFTAMVDNKIKELL